MADPATIAKVAQAVISQMKDEESRKRLLVLLLIPIVLLLLIIASPVAIFFAVVGNPAAPGVDEPSIGVIMYELEQELLSKVESEKNTGDYDELKIIYEGSEDNIPIINIQDVIAVYSVLSDMKGLDGDPEAVARLTEKQVELLKKTFWEMNQITVTWEEKEIPYDGPTLYDDEGNELPDPPPETIKIKIITINSLSYLEVIDDYGFNEDQEAVVHELMDAKYAELFIGTAILKSRIARQAKTALLLQAWERLSNISVGPSFSIRGEVLSCLSCSSPRRVTEIYWTRLAARQDIF